MHDRGGPDPCNMGGNMGGPLMPSGGMGGGINPQILHQLGIDGPITNTVFVANVILNNLFKIFVYFIYFIFFQTVDIKEF